jgi:predicted enzyme related to lactoylglutathione lyase
MKSHIANGIGHFDVSGPDASVLKSFYAGVFGWAIDTKGPGYSIIQTPAGSPKGAILEAEEASLTIGVVVPDIDQAVVAALEQGGGVAMPVVDNGWVKKAVLRDPAGNKLTIIQA